MKRFEKIDRARRLLGLAEEASLEEIKEAFRNLSLKYHPDRCKDQDKKHCEEMFKKINQAYENLLSYCENYRYPLSKERIKKEDRRSRLEERFKDDWLTR